MTKGDFPTWQIDEPYRRKKRAKPEITRKSKKTSGHDAKELLSKLDAHPTALKERTEIIRRGQSEKKNTQSSYFDLYDFAPVSYFTLDNDGRILGMNLASAELLGISIGKKKLLGTKFTKFIMPDYVDAFNKHMEKNQEAGVEQRCELEMVGESGNPFYAQMESVPVFDRHGNFEQFRIEVLDVTECKRAEEALANARDETEARVALRTAELAEINKELSREVVERRHAEEALRESEAFASSLLANSPIPKLVINTDSSIRYVNPALEALTGYSAAEIVGMKAPYPWWPEERHHIIRPKFERAMQHGGIKEEERFLSRAGKELWVEITSTVVKREGDFNYFLSSWVDITERKKVEEALKAAEQNFRNSIDNSPLGIRIVTEDGELLYANQAILDIYGYSTIEELKNMPARERYTPESYVEHKERLRKRKLGEQLPPDYGISIVKKDGETRHLHVLRKEVVWNSEKQYQVLYEDVTEGRLAREAQIQSEQKYRGLVEASVDMIVAIDLNGKFIFVNKSMEERMGYSKDELVKMKGYELVYPEDLKATKKQLAKLLEGRNIENMQLRAKTKGGELINILANISPIFDVEGNVESILAFSSDITRYREAEEELRESETLLRLLLEQTPCVLWTTDRDLKLTSMKGLRKANVDFVGERFAGMTLAEYLLLDDYDSQPLKVHRRAMIGKPGTFESELLREFEGGVFRCRVEPLRDISGGIIGVVGAAVDITENKRIENDLRALSRQLVKVQEEERRAISREMHDQIGQSLTVLKLLIARAKRSPAEKIGVCLDEAKEQVTELMARVRDMSLDLCPSMLDDLGLLPTLLWYFERYTSQTQVYVIFKHEKLKQNIPREVCTTAYRIIQEALTNVARYAEVSTVAIRTWVDEDILCVQIEDKGNGFDLGLLPAGTSSGLSGMRERAHLLGGKLDLESSPGNGTCITAELPFQYHEKRPKIIETA